MLGRLLGFVLFLLFAGGFVYNWYLLINHGYFYLKLSGLAPFGALGGLLMIFFPSLAGPPSHLDKRSKVIVWVLIAVGLALGAINFYLMSNYRP
ncbi:MAG: hypothetical protein WCF57_22305 [Pyrinomonadaceae bacterium]